MLNNVRHLFFAVSLTAIFITPTTGANAGTTGVLNGLVTDNTTKAPVSGARVTVASPSQSAGTSTDASGHYAFVWLSPDTYMLSVEKGGFNPLSESGISVFADQTTNIPLVVDRSLRTIGRVGARSASGLVRASTTSDVYSVDTATQGAVAVLGGGGNIDNAYSAIASTPGVQSAINGSSWGQSVYVHGSSSSQVGYEYDGIPVNRAFDNNNSNTLTNLGQQELQVFTGGAPAGSASQTVGGYINQVIKTGTYPGSGSFNLGVGSPVFYNSGRLEYGAATPHRNFSYYVGYSQDKQDYRFQNQFNDPNLGFAQPFSYNGTNTFLGIGPFPNCVNGANPFSLARGSPGAIPVGSGGNQGCLNRFPANAGQAKSTQDREFVTNVHIGVPYGKNGMKDDIQVVYSVGYLTDLYNDSLKDLGGSSYFTAVNGAVPNFPDGYVFRAGTTFLQNAATVGAPSPYLFPNTKGYLNRSFQSPLDPSAPGSVEVDSAIFKLQYQHNFSSNAFARIYGYTNYSDWLQTDPLFGATFYGNAGATSGATPFSAAGDYDLITHTRGGAFDLFDQLNSRNLLSLTANYSTATTIRDNNSTYGNTLDTSATSLVSSARGVFTCYGVVTGNAAPCLSSETRGTFGDPLNNNPSDPRFAAGSGTAFDSYTGNGQPPAGSAAALAGAKYLVTNVGPTGTYNTVRPFFQSYELGDQFQATDKFLLSLGVRLESYHYALPPANSDEYKFWFQAAQNSYCYDPQTFQAVLTPLGPGQQPGSNAPVVAVNCPANANGVPTLHPDGKNGHLLYSNSVLGDVVRTAFEPRVSGTYAFTPDNVFRFSFGKYAQPVQTAYVEYLNKSPQSAASFNFTNFWNLGFTTPEHNLSPSISYNTDVSLEHHFPHTDWSLSVSPFYRHTLNQYQDALIGTNFSSSYPNANQNSFGYEVALRKGDVNRNGFSGQLAYTFTKTSVAFLTSPTGSNTIDVANSYVDDYNGLTAKGNRFGVKGAPCYANANSAVPGTAYGGCTAANGRVTMDANGLAAGDVINPYYFSATQPLLDRSAPYPAYQTAPSDPTTANNSALAPPVVIAGFLSYKHARFTITPSFQLQSGNYYGDPFTVTGIDPRTCTGNQSAVPTATNRGLPNYIRCGPALTNSGYLAIPNPENGNKFDGYGQFIDPWVFDFNTQLSYELSKSIRVNLLLANLVNTCFGGTKAAWSDATAPSHDVCGYTPGQYVSNYYNGSSPSDVKANGVATPAQFAHAYQPVANPFFPFSAYLQVQMRL